MLTDAHEAVRGSVEIDLQPVDIGDLDVDVPMYSIDPLVRRGVALQQTQIAIEPEGQ